MKIGDKVEWSSQAGSHWKTKQGEIVAVVPDGKTPFALNDWPDIMHGRNAQPIDPRTLSRRGESYVVLVGRTLYWPRVSALRSSNARPVRTDGPLRDSGTHEAVVGRNPQEDKR